LSADLLKAKKNETHRNEEEHVFGEEANGHRRGAETKRSRSRSRSPSRRQSFSESASSGSTSGRHLDSRRISSPSSTPPGSSSSSSSSHSIVHAGTDSPQFSISIPIPNSKQPSDSSSSSSSLGEVVPGRKRSRNQYESSLEVSPSAEKRAKLSVHDNNDNFPSSTPTNEQLSSVNASSDSSSSVTPIKSASEEIDSFLPEIIDPDDWIAEAWVDVWFRTRFSQPSLESSSSTPSSSSSSSSSTPSTLSFTIREFLKTELNPFLRSIGFDPWREDCRLYQKWCSRNIHISAERTLPAEIITNRKPFLLIERHPNNISASGAMIQKLNSIAQSHK
jgi:hypothetical protein